MTYQPKRSQSLTNTDCNRLSERTVSRLCNELDLSGVGNGLDLLLAIEKQIGHRLPPCGQSTSHSFLGGTVNSWGIFIDSSSPAGNRKVTEREPRAEASRRP